MEKTVSSLKDQLAAYQAREEAVNEREKELREVMKTINLGLQVLGKRALTFASMLASIIAFGFAVWEPTGMRIAASCLFTVIVFLPALWADAK